jgi:hypothetical protein
MESASYKVLKDAKVVHRAGAQQGDRGEPPGGFQQDSSSIKVSDPRNTGSGETLSGSARDGQNGTCGGD